MLTPAMCQWAWQFCHCVRDDVTPFVSCMRQTSVRMVVFSQTIHEPSLMYSVIHLFFFLCLSHSESVSPTEIHPRNKPSGATLSGKMFNCLGTPVAIPPIANEQLNALRIVRSVTGQILYQTKDHIVNFSILNSQQNLADIPSVTTRGDSRSHMTTDLWARVCVLIFSTSV